MAFNDKPDFIIYDMNMSEIDGFAFCEFLQLNPETCHIPVVFLVNGCFQADEERLHMAGVLDIIKKPINEKEFILRMNAFHRFINIRKKRKTENIYKK
jgi:response regulator RpfG family c-di-GMP phosphodiesterase